MELKSRFGGGPISTRGAKPFAVWLRWIASRAVGRSQHRVHLFGGGLREATQGTAVNSQLVKAALHDLESSVALGRSQLRLLPCVSQRGHVAAEVRALLVDVICDLAASTAPRDAESGRILFDYYVKKVGSHEVVMERLHLSRPTFYRRLTRGFAVLAQRLNELSEFAYNVGLENSPPTGAN